ncbi:MAG: AmmeMemoRadiSam system radical SAM enzyme [Planctomycetaceae bacterium]|nr:AmmeMemoRadiSam system radical SAM enzyme [Planctomycetaceae bacterium]
MGRVVQAPSGQRFADGTAAGGWWHELDQSGHIMCDLCPRHCTLKPGDRGFCFVRQNVDGQLVSTTYGRSTGFCVDPIEKKPLNHFLPGTAVLSFGTAGCNLGCKFCQNWDSSRSRAVDRASDVAEPATIAEAAVQLGCHSVAFTYNDPVIWAEYAIDTAHACHERGIRTVAVTNGYIAPQARCSFFEVIDAANVDLKAFQEAFYYKLTNSHLQPVLDSLTWLHRDTDVWLEITNLIIPGENDAPDELRRMCDWLLEHVGDEVPLHFTAFHPDFRMRDHPATPHETLLAAYELARSQGIKYVYVGNVHDPQHDSTYCPACGTLLIARNWHQVGAYHLRDNRCAQCAAPIAGRFLDQPGEWGQRRLPVRIAQFARAAPQPPQAEPAPAGAAGPARVPDPDDPAAPPRNSSLGLTPREQQQILRVACEMVVAGVCQRAADLSDQSCGGAAQRPVAGVFVTLKRGSHLRACCGFLGARVPLLEALQNAAHRTATSDMRLPPISPAELPHLHVAVSILHDFRPVTEPGPERLRAVEVGRHGLRIQHGEAAGLLLPVVAVENGWDAETFLRQVCRKAGLPVRAWQDDAARLQTFEAVLIEGRLDPDLLATAPPEAPPLLQPEDLQRLAAHCRGNVVALVLGATPNYYLPSCPDMNVQSVGLAVRIPQHHFESTSSQLSLRPGLPLQSTLYQCAERAAQAIKSMQLPTDALDEIHAEVAVLYDSAMHGSVSDADLQGLDPQRRALVVLERGRYGWTFDRDRTPRELLDATAERVQVLNPRTANVLSLSADSSCRSMAVSSLPHPQRGTAVRPPAVAGVFYPSEPAALDALVDELLAGTPDAPRVHCPVVMVPHAGLRYSGRIAARVFQQIVIPDRVIVLAPKHSRQGTPWSVAPHDNWAIPGHVVPSDPELARRLAAAIPGLQLDAAAHQDEHAIEVQLPVLARLAPAAAVVGIIIGDGDLEHCQQFGRLLADFLRAEDPQPLLVISSDLNHYAPIDENRRLDRLALDAIRTCDPAQLYATVRDQDISMCGLLPAVVALEALRRLGPRTACREVAYATSADAGGSRDRVVGYAGLLWG